MDEIKRITDEIVEEILKDTEKVMWKIARTTHIPGYDADDLMQEMRIKVWQTVIANNYDPERVKPSSFFHRVCKNLLIDLNKSKIFNYKTTTPQNREYRDVLDQKCADDDDVLPKIGCLQANFVQNLSESFVNLVLLDEVQNEKRGISKKSS